MLLVTASTERLLLAAEMMEMKKKHKDGFHREVTVQDIENFDGSGKGKMFLLFTCLTT